MTPPRLRGLVDGLERAVRMEYRCPKAQRSTRKQETLAAKLRLLQAIAVIAKEPCQ
ncbi:hypothetical protein FHR70_000663 [Microvirga lupini]|uniref:Transposase n=1 Tax=Microvirga lupini TaxID=420324 RepID=A0A7W4VI53_9HYPH|nr:hypothetical protein [Microvirga lupini]MBB3017623.1 hypothetical protein [Microvirga lupini]